MPFRAGWTPLLHGTVVAGPAGRRTLQPQGQKKAHRLALRATTPFETPLLAKYFSRRFALVEYLESWLQRGWSRVRQKDAYRKTVCGATPPKPKIARWGSLAALGLAFWFGSPRLLQFPLRVNVCSEARDTEA